MTTQRLRAQAAATVILVLGLLLLGPLLYLHDQWLSEGVRRAHLMSQLSGVRQNLAKGHLWFEEHLVGDPTETDKKWRNYFNVATEIATSYLESLKEIDPEVLGRPIFAVEDAPDSELFRIRIEEGATHSDLVGLVIETIEEMIVAAEGRIAKGSRPGDDLDISFDALNARVDSYTIFLDTDWQTIGKERLSERQRIHDFAILTWGSCLAGFVVLLAFVHSRRRVAEEEQRRLQERFQQAQKLESLGVLAGGIAHDFNNLLMGVLGNASMAQLEQGVPEPVARQLAEIERSARKSADLTTQLLAYAGKGKFSEEVIDLGYLITDLEGLLRVSLGANVVVEHEFAAELPPVRGNSTQLQQVVMNLIINASEAMGERGGKIIVRTGSGEFETAELIVDSQGIDDPATGRYVHLQVEDEGPGMDPSTLARCFEPFYTTKFTGRGLGLAAVVGIVRGHHGVIRVESHPGQGTHFSILLPAIAGEATHRAGLVESHRVECGTGRLLVIDDDESVRLLVDRMLRRCGYDVVLAASGEEGLARFRGEHQRLRAVLVDMEMPGLSGVETGAALRRFDPAVPVILTSGYSEDLLREGDGFVGFIQKPYRIEDLSTQLMRILGSEAENGENGG